ncbi:MAG: hypothetical protein WA192_05750 [Candidatus Acidiferrales bacterium]
MTVALRVSAAVWHWMGMVEVAAVGWYRFNGNGNGKGKGNGDGCPVR